VRDSRQFGWFSVLMNLGRRLLLAASILALPVLASGQTDLTSMAQLQADLNEWERQIHGGDNVILIFAPPLSVDPQVSGDNTDAAQRALLLVTDIVPLPAKFVAASGRTTYAVYGTILKNRAPEQWILSDDQRHQLKHAEHILLRQYCVFERLYWFLAHKAPPRENSKRYDRYLRYSREYAGLQTNQSQALDDGKRAQIQGHLNKLAEEWKRKGDKDRVELALSQYRTVQASSPEVFWANVTNLFLSNVRTMGAELIPISKVDPPAQSWAGAGGWQQWAVRQSSAQLKSVAITRKWMNLDVLTVHRWSWASGLYEQQKVVVSDGRGITSDLAGRELMPLLPISVILAKNVVSSSHVISSDTPVILGLRCKVLPKLPQ